MVLAVAHSALMGLATSVETDGSQWLWQYESRHFLRRRIPDLFESLASNEQMKEPLRSVTEKLVARSQINVPAAVLRHHFFAYGMFNRDQRSEYERFTFLSKDDVASLSTTISNILLQWMAADIDKLKFVISGQVFFVALDLGTWTQQQRDRLSTLCESPDALLALALVFYDNEGRTEFVTLDKLLDRSLFIAKLNELKDTEWFEKLNPNTKAALARATDKSEW